MGNEFDMWNVDNVDITDYYKLVSNPKDSKIGAVEITAGPFSGMIYKYGDFQFVKPETEDAAKKTKVTYEFEVIHMPEEMMNVEYPDVMKESFDQLMVGILLDMVKKDTERKARVDYDSSDGESDIDESFERRVFYETGNTVSEE